MTPICLHCGYDLATDELITLDGFTLDPRGVTDFNGQAVQLTRAQSIILASIAKVAPRPISYAALVDRAGIDGQHERNILAAQVCHMRNRFDAYGIPMPIIAVRGVGYQWKGDKAKGPPLLGAAGREHAPGGRAEVQDQNEHCERGFR
jgi:DNA-binding response OmpR family regulator